MSLRIEGTVSALQISFLEFFFSDMSWTKFSSFATVAYYTLSRTVYILGEGRRKCSLRCLTWTDCNEFGGPLGIKWAGFSNLIITNLHHD